MFDWPSYRLGDISELITKGTTPTTYGFDFVETGINFLRVNNISDSGQIEYADTLFIDDRTHAFLNRSQLRQQDIVLSIAGTVGRTAVIDERLIPANCNQALAVIRLKSGFSPEFISRLLRSEEGRKQISSDTVQLAQANFSLGQIRNLTFQIPELEEQEALVLVLDTLDTAILETEAIIAKLKAVKQGLLHDLLTRGIDANGELRPPQSEAPDLYKRSLLGWIPKDWDVVTVESISTNSVIGPFGSDLVAADYRNEGVPVVFVRDIKPNRFEWKSNVFVNSSKAKSLSAHEVCPGDVVATKMGFIAAVYPVSMPNGIVTADIVRLRLKLDSVRSDWMALFMNSQVVIKQVEQITAGVTRPKVTLRDVRNLMILLPNVEEQDRILERFHWAELRIQNEEGLVQKLSDQKSALMNDLLTGRVRVTPLIDPAAA